MATIILNKNNFFNNLDIITGFTKTKEKIALVVKDNAYGHGLQEMATLANEYGIVKAVVQNEEEAQKIEHLFEYILVLADYPTKPSQKIRYTINDLHSISKFPKGSLVELKIDSGMHRNGVSPDELYTAFVKIKEQGLVLEGLLTHHRSADELSSEWFWQNENFAKVKKHADELSKQFGFDSLRYHSSNSAALLRHVDFDEDMARVGIAAYGCIEMPPSLQIEGFKPVLSVYASKNSSREVKKGQRVGYGATFEASEECIVSNYDFGYGDGFLRTCSNNFVNPHAKVLVGRISMDNCSFLSDEDEILVFDDARVVAKSANTISYEVLTSLKENIKRVIRE